MRKRAVIPPSVPLALPDNSDPMSLDENAQKVEVIPEASGPSETDTKKHRFEPDNAEPMELLQSDMSSIFWPTNTLHEHEIYEIDVGDPLEHWKSFSGDPTVWMSNKLLDGEATEVSHHRLSSDQPLLLDEAMTKESSQVLAADAFRRLSREEELHL